MAKDWIAEAAEEIWTNTEGASRLDIIESIRRYSPFAPNVAYMPVPRCDGCRHWDAHGDKRTGDCSRFSPQDVTRQLKAWGPRGGH